MKWKRRNVVYGSIALLVLLIVILALRPNPVRVETADVVSGPMAVMIESRGETRVRDRFVINSPISGRVERIELREGATVQKGDVVARVAAAQIDPRQREESEARMQAAEAARREAESAVRIADGALELARRERQRMEQLVGEGVATAQMLDQARTSEERAEREVDAARQRLQAARSNLAAAGAALSRPGQAGSLMEVSAPVGGRVFRVPERSERVVQAGQPLLELGDTQALELEIDVLSEDAVRISPGDRVIVERWGGEQPLQGVVRLVEPSAFTKISALGIEEQRVNVLADLESPPPQLGDAFRIEAKIVVWEAENVLKVPVSALARADGGWSVFVVENERAYRRPIELGHRNPLEAEVLKGLKAGDLVIVHPGNDVRDEVRVRVDG